MTWGPNRRQVQGRAAQDRRRRVVARHGGICHLCHHPDAEIADHVHNLAAGGADTEAGMRPAHGQPCPTCGKRCHDLKTAAEAQAARTLPPRRNAPEPHPGLIHRSTP